MNGYQILEKLGRGGMGDVYLAYHPTLDRNVAIKLLKEDLIDDEEFVERFLREAKFYARLKHPNIVRVFDTGEDNGRPYIVMELLEGEDLRKRLSRGALPLNEAIRILQSILEALKEAHVGGIIHRDIKADNIFLCQTGDVKVMDLGIAKAIDLAKMTSTGQMIGTPAYMSPEQAQGMAVDFRSDLYSVGILLHFMLAGELPFRASPPLAVLRMHLERQPPSLPRSVPSWLRRIVVKALAKKPEERFQSAEEMLAAIKEGSGSRLEDLIPDDADRISVITNAVAKQTPKSPKFHFPLLFPPFRGRRIVNLENSSTNLPAIPRKAAVKWVGILIGISLLISLFRWIATPNRTPAVTLPEFVGRSIEEVRVSARDSHIRLLEHGEYSDKPRNLVYHTDSQRGDQIRPNHIVNVWYSKGPVFITVPNVVGLTREEAEKKLVADGLTVGKVALEFSEKAARGIVIRQDVFNGRRVEHEAAVGLIISDGPKPALTNSDHDVPASSTSNPSDLTDAAYLNSFDRTITINKDGQGTRQVRVEYADADGDHSPVIDEIHGEGDRIPIKFSYRGKKINLRIYYNDQLKMNLKDLDPEATRHQRITQPELP